MNEKPFFNSGFEHDEHFAFAYPGFNEILDTTALGDEVVIYYNGVIHEDNAIYTKAIVQNNTTDVIDNDKVKQILTNIGILEYGVYVYYKEKYYLVTDVPGDNKFYGKGIMQQCNYLLKWVNDLGNVIEQWSIVKNVTKEYATGLSEGEDLILGITTISLYLPKNEETVKLTQYDRLIIDDYDHSKFYHPNVYKITKLNLTQKNDLRNSLYIYTLEDAEYNIENDNPELMIADYYNRIRVRDIELISPQVIDIQKGLSFDIRARVTVNGKYTDDEIALRSSNENIVKVEGSRVIGISLGQAKIYLESKNIVKEITANIVDIVRRFQNTSHIEFTGRSEIRIGLAKRFDARFFDANGNETNNLAQWSIEDESGKKPAFIESWQEGNSIWLRSATTDWIIGNKITLILNGLGGLSDDRVVLTIASLT